MRVLPLTCPDDRSAWTGAGVTAFLAWLDSRAGRALGGYLGWMWLRGEGPAGQQLMRRSQVHVVGRFRVSPPRPSPRSSGRYQPPRNG